jgi:hypothetical protein
MDNEKEKLRKLVNLLPLDKWQLGSVENEIDRMPLEKATRIAKDLAGAIKELPKVVAKFSIALEKSTKD